VSRKVVQAEQAQGTGNVRLGGKPYREIVARYVARTFAAEGLDVYQEVAVGSSIIGKKRKADLLILAPPTGQAVVLQTKFQSAHGTTDEKIHYALADCAAMWIPAVVVYGGGGWSSGVRHTLESSRFAVQCEVDANGKIITEQARELDVFLASVFQIWKLILGKKQAVTGDAA
jgi:hypothetical protein